jgi:hypothetical protein
MVFSTEAMQDASLELKKTSLLSELDEQISEDSRQIEVLEKRKMKNEALRKALRESLGAANPIANTGYGTKVQLVQKAIDALPKTQFTQNDVEAELRRTNPEMEIDRDRIRAVIWSLAKKHKTIKLITKGNNRQPAQFEKQSNQSNGELNPPKSAPSRIPPPRKSVIGEL